MTTLDELVTCLSSPTATGSGADPSTQWQGTTLGLAGGHVFGGQMIGQAIMIGARLHPDKVVKSISVVFPRATRDPGTLDYDAGALHSGSLYATTRVDCSPPGRDGAPALTFGAQLMHRSPVEPPDASIEHSAAMPDVDTPDDARPVDLGMVPWDTRIVGSTDLNDPSPQPAQLALWMRVDDRLPDDQALHQALLAFSSELTLIGTALLPHEGWSQLDAHRTLRTSVLAHAVQFHRPFRLDDWLLITQSSPAASGGSAFGSGHVFTAAGELVASFEHESMIRIEEERR